jgi:hypothetical protein
MQLTRVTRQSEQRSSDFKMSDGFRHLWLPPLVPATDGGVAHAFNENRCVGIYFSRSLDSFGLSALVVTDSLGTRPPNRIIAFFLSTLDKQLYAHKILLQIFYLTGPRSSLS